MPTRRLFADHRGAELMQAARALVSHLDLEEVLTSLLDAALAFTGARFAAIGVMAPDGRELERFVIRGIDDEGARTVSDLPGGRAILEELIRDPTPALNHGDPAVRPSVGVPIVLRGTPWGTLYLTEKPGGRFDRADEDAALVLAEWAAIAIDNARAYALSEGRRQDLERAVTALEVSMDIAHAVGAERDIDQVLGLVVRRGRALVGARTVVISLLEDEHLVIAAVAGRRHGLVEGSRHPLTGSMTESVIRSERAMRFEGTDPRMGSLRGLMTLTDDVRVMVVPLNYRGRVLGTLAAIDRLAGAQGFTEEDERLLSAFAASVATAVAAARSVMDDRLRAVLQAEERERMRWARELHDDTLQHLAALSLELSIVHRRVADPELQDILQGTIDQATRQVRALRTLIADLRPAGLDDLGLGAAMRELVERAAEHDDIEIDLDLDLRHGHGEPAGRLEADVEAAVYRLAQESLTNVAAHADATCVTVTLHEEEGLLHLEVIDDGVGFDVGLPRTGFGVTGMHERVKLLGGTLEITSRPGHTAVHARLPVRTPVAPQHRERVEQPHG